MFDVVQIHMGPTAFHGLVTPGDPGSPIALHLHGTGGNFYGNKIATALAPIYLRKGLRFATINLPGYDSAYETEVFAQYAPALTQWLESIARGRFILQGHSLGALKILDFLTKAKHTSECIGAVLFSPFDIVAFYTGRRPELAANFRERAREIIAKQGAHSRIGPDMFDIWPISASTYLEMIEEGGLADRFSSRDAAGLRKGLWVPSVPTLVFIGAEDFAAYPSPTEVFELLPGSAPHLTPHLIAGAPHNFDGQVEVIESHLDRWLQSIT